MKLTIKTSQVDFTLEQDYLGHDVLNFVTSIIDKVTKDSTQLKDTPFMATPGFTIDHNPQPPQFRTYCTNDEGEILR
jgi:hypothetical protein